MEGCITKPIVIDDDVEMVSSPVMADFSVSEKALHAPHRHSRNTATIKAPKHTSQPTSTASKKRGRGHGNRRSELQEEVRYLLEESLDDSMEVDDDDNVASSPESAVYAANLCQPRSSKVVMKEAQPPASLSRHESSRVPISKYEGKKRTCCSAGYVKIISPATMYGEVA